MKRSIILVLFFLMIMPGILFSETAVGVDMDVFLTFTRAAKDAWFFGYSAAPDLNFRSVKNENVKGQLSLEVFSPELITIGSTKIAWIELKKAFIKANFTLDAQKSIMLRMTVGKNRLSWGDGLIFNSGDIIFGSASPVLDFSQLELRDDTAWMAAFNLQVAPFVFMEFVALPPEIALITPDSLSLLLQSQAAKAANPEAVVPDQGIQMPGIEKSSAGGRLYVELGKTRSYKLETGYLFSGQSRVAVPDSLDIPLHRIYCSLQGNEKFNWNISSGVSFPQKDKYTEDMVKKLWTISGGISYTYSISNSSSIGFRVETMIAPFGYWAKPEAKAEDMPYGIFLYPEINYSPTNTLSLSARSMISPVDASAQVSAAVSWNVYQGLDLIAMLNVNAGSDSSTFAWDRATKENALLNAGTSGLGIITGLRYKF